MIINYMDVTALLFDICFMSIPVYVTIKAVFELLKTINQHWNFNKGK